MKIKSGIFFIIYLLLTGLVSWLYSQWGGTNTDEALIIFVVLLVLGVIVYRKRNQLKLTSKSLMGMLNPPIQELEQLEGRIWYRALKVLYTLAYFLLPYWFWSNLFNYGYQCSVRDIRGRCTSESFNLGAAFLTLLASVIISLVLLFVLRRMTIYVIFGSKK